MKTYYGERIDILAHEIAIYDQHKDQYITFEFKAHKANPFGQSQETTKISMDSYSSEILKALAEALSKMGITEKLETITSSELKATKFHLEDMRKLVFKDQPKQSI